MKIELSEVELAQLITILGAAQGAFKQAAEERASGIFSALLNNFADGAEDLSQEILRQAHNR